MPLLDSGWEIYRIIAKFATVLCTANQTVVNFSSSGVEAQEVVDFIEAAGGRAKAIKSNVATTSAVKELFDQAEAEFGPVDVRVNNTGILKNAPLAEVTGSNYQRQISVNLTGTINGMREGAKRVRDGDRIINFSTSIIGTFLTTYSVYAATKAAVEAMTHVLAKEPGPRPITFNAVAPGPVATELFLTGKSEELLQRMVKDIPLGRLGEPDDIARIVSFLASPESGWVNGQVLKANGGQTDR